MRLPTGQRACASTLGFSQNYVAPRSSRPYPRAETASAFKDAPTPHSSPNSS